MPVLKLTAYTGEQPRMLPRLLPDTAAQDAFNVRLDDGGLTPIRLSVQQASLSHSDVKTIYRHGEDWLSWPTHVNACPGPVASDRLYYTGDGSPKIRVGNHVYPLRVPRPEKALTAKLERDTKPEKEGDKARDVITRNYVYTYVTEFGEESEPCPVSSGLDWKAGQIIRLSGFKESLADRAMRWQRIYRTQTSKSGTYLYFIEERIMSNEDYIDEIPIDRFNEVLPSATWNEPPDTLEGLTAMPNGMMAAFSGRDLYFCEPWRPHAWPERYLLSTDADIVALGAVGTALIVLTTGQPYLCNGSSPDTMQMVKLEANYPCINARAVVDLGFCIVYPSHEGLVAVGGDGNVRLISANLFNRDAWLSLSPQTMVAGQLSGRYVAFYNTVYQKQRLTGALFVDAGQTPFLIRAAEQANAVYYEISTGALHYVRPNEKDIYRLDSPEGDRHTLYWRSKQFYLSTPENFGVILVEADRNLTGEEIKINQQAIEKAIAQNVALLAKGPVKGEINSHMFNSVPLGGDILKPLPRLNGTLNVGVIADGKKVAQISRTNIPQRLPSGFLARKWEIDVSGDVTISTITMTKTIDELKSAP